MKDSALNGNYIDSFRLNNNNCMWFRVSKFMVFPCDRSIFIVFIESLMWKKKYVVLTSSQIHVALHCVTFLSSFSITFAFDWHKMNRWCFCHYLQESNNQERERERAKRRKFDCSFKMMLSFANIANNVCNVLVFVIVCHARPQNRYSWLFRAGNTSFIFVFSG